VSVTIVPATLASIPSPSSGSLEIGPLVINIYGLMIALGLLAAIWLLGRRLEEHGIGTRDDAGAIGLWGGLAGVIGARLYHVATDWDRFSGNLEEIPRIWEGGLGIPGGVLCGVLAGLWVARRRGLPLGEAANCAAPAIALGQAIGRWGNYFNQELFGKPTDLPWALEIDDDHLPPGYPPGTTFHPTFLYESLWNFGLVGVLLWIDRKYRPAPWRLFAMYVTGYGLGRFWIEGLRIDEADELAGLRWNQWVALAAIVGGLAYLVFGPRRPSTAVDAEVATDDEPADELEVVTDDRSAEEVADAESEPESDEPESDEPESDEPESDEPESDEPGDEPGDELSPEPDPPSPSRTDGPATAEAAGGSDRPAPTS
jgi:prolipoprotein diacylglyceryl transferase